MSTTHESPLYQCRVIPKNIEKIKIRLFEEEIDVIQFLCFLYDLSYEQLFCKLAKEHIEQEILNNKDYTCKDYGGMILD